MQRASAFVTKNKIKQSHTTSVERQFKLLVNCFKTIYLFIFFAYIEFNIRKFSKSKKPHLLSSVSNHTSSLHEQFILALGPKIK